MVKYCVIECLAPGFGLGLMLGCTGAAAQGARGVGRQAVRVTPQQVQSAVLIAKLEAQVAHHALDFLLARTEAGGRTSRSTRKPHAFGHKNLNAPEPLAARGVDVGSSRMGGQEVQPLQGGGLRRFSATIGRCRVPAIKSCKGQGPASARRASRPLRTRLAVSPPHTGLARMAPTRV